MSFRKFLPIALLVSLGIVCLVRSALWLNLQSSDDIKWFGVNYYPQGKLWRDFWQDFARTEIERDFSEISQLGLNTVRIFVHHEFFTTNSQEGIAKLRQIFDIAAAHQLKIILTLFDWAKPYQFNFDSEDFKRGALTIVEAVATHPALLMVDLKNEADHDFISDDRIKVNDWLLAAFMNMKARWQHINFTIGWLWIFEDIRINHELDVLSFHHFPEQGPLLERIKRFKNAFPTKPLLLEEVGKSTVGNESDHLDLEQSEFLENAIYLTLKERLSGALVWSMHDHPSEKGQKRPSSENGFGLFTLDGTAKQAAKMLQSGRYFNANNSQFCLSTQHGTLTVSSPLLSLVSVKKKLSPGYHCIEIKGWLSSFFNAIRQPLQIQTQGLARLNLAPISKI